MDAPASVGADGAWGQGSRVSKGSDLLAAALEEEGIKYIFAVPGEEKSDCSVSRD